ncbi:MAG: PQQ-binding-like beta-propeller repeat protein [Candidatus Eremiobacteraeota bacterium]|nr:PQQ-binding-like beta-propeller repeat protein [Candidatus Eremiobacteraeota bacterium]
MPFPEERRLPSGYDGEVLVSGGGYVRAALGFFLTAVLTLAAVAATLPPAMPVAWETMRLVPSLNAAVADARTPHWTFASGGAYSSSPVVVGGVTYLSDNNGNLNALDVATGKPLWHAKFANSLMSAPITANGLVYVGEGNEDSTTYVPRSRVQVGLHDNALIAVDAKSGRMRWRFALRGTGMPTSALVDGKLIHHDGYGDIVALDATTGALRWRRDVRSVSSMSAVLPIAAGRLVSAGIFPNEVIAFNAADGSSAWTRTFSGSASGLGDCPLAFDGTYLFGTYLGPVSKPVDPGDPAIHHLYALRASDGALVWDRALERGDTPPRNEAAIPVVAGGVVYDGSSVAPYMHALDAKTGRLLWKREVKGPVKGAPIIVRGVVYFGDLHGYLWALEAQTGRVLGALRTGVRFNVGSPVAVGGSLLIGSVEGVVVMLPLAEFAKAKDF